MKCLLIGNYGVGNLGDEALKEYFLEQFDSVDWVVVGVDVPRLPFGLRSFFSKWWLTLAAYKRADAIVFGGGSLFTDIESIKAPLMWGWHAYIAWILRKPIYLCFQGIGPFRTRLGERITRWICTKSSHLSVRDPLSFERMSSWRLNTEVVQSFDPVFSLIEEQNTDTSSKNVISVIPRDNSCVEELISCHPEGPAVALRDDPRKLRIPQGDMQAVSKDDRSLRIISMKPEAERSLCLELQSTLEGEIYPARTLGELAKAITGSTHVVTARYHGAIAALALGLSFEAVTQQPGDKLDALSALEGKSKNDLLDLVKVGEEALRKLLKP